MKNIEMMNTLHHTSCLNAHNERFKGPVLIRLLLLSLFIGYGIAGYAQPIVFTDPYFKQALIDEGVDISMDGEIDQSEALLITNLDVSFDSIADLNGIENFTNLTSLNCSANFLTEVNIASNSLLQHFDCSSNSIMNLDVSENSSLINLLCDGNYLTNLELGSIDQIERLSCYGGDLVTLDLTSLINLRYLDVSVNNFTSIDLSNNVMLDTLFCSYVYPLDTLDVSNNPNLTYLSCRNSNLSYLLLNNPVLEYIRCHNNYLQELDLSAVPSLKELLCHYNNLTSLDLSNLYNLDRVIAGYNDLVELNISGDSLLTFLGATNNSLDSIIKGNNPLLENIQLDHNNFSNFDFTGLPSLRYFYGRDNKFSHFTVDHPNLENLNLWYNDSLTFLDISTSTSIRQLNLAYNDQPITVCVWTMPFPPDISPPDSGSVVVSDYGSPNLTFTDDCTLSNQDVVLHDFNVFPNPVIDKINIETGITLLQPVTISLYDVQGKLFFQEVRTPSDLIQLEVSRFHQGIYILRLVSDEYVVQKKVIFQ